MYATLLAIYLLRRQRRCNDIDDAEWQRFQQAGHLFFGGFLLHYLPYLFVERTMFLHNYMPALLFKIMLLCFVLDHIGGFCNRRSLHGAIRFVYGASIAAWLLAIVWVFGRFSVLSYGTTELTADNVQALRWKDTWDFILHKDLSDVD